ncbi:MAG: hypothetical protein J1E06_06435 [Acutalibacter sp.]|nr:hypothetical protein [Acutalibacter sp.]
MDVEKWKTALKQVFSKGKGTNALLLLGACGILLIYLSTLFSSDEGKKSEALKERNQEEAVTCEKRLEQELARIVSAITGEEDPAVMVTLKSGSRYVYAADEREREEERERSTVILKDSDGAQQALPITEIQPKVKGVVIVSKYAGDPTIREKLLTAVRTVLDVSSARICVTDSGYG